MLLPQQDSARETRPITPAVPEPTVAVPNTAYVPPVPAEASFPEYAEPAYEAPPAPDAPTYAAPAPPVEPVYAAPVEPVDAPPVEPTYAPATAPAAPVSAAPPGYTPPAAPAPPPAAGPGGGSAAPPGFTQQRILAAESATLVALDPTEDETTAAPVVREPVETIGGSALVARLARLAPRSGDGAKFGRERESTVRVASAVLVCALLVVFAGPPVLRLLDGLPVIGAMVEQLRELGKYYDAFGPQWIIAWLGAVTAGGVVVAQMETRAKKLDLRDDPDTRLNIALAGLVSLTVVSSIMMLGRSSGWIAAGSTFAFFIAMCLAIPAGRLPGARAMAPQTPRAWGLLTIVAIVGFVIQPSLPTLVVAAVAFRHLVRNWDELSADDQPIFSLGARPADPARADVPDVAGIDPSQLDPAALATELAPKKVDGTNRFSALVLLLAVVLVASIGMRVTAVPEIVLVPNALDNPTSLPGAERGPTIPPPTP